MSSGSQLGFIRITVSKVSAHLSSHCTTAACVSGPESIGSESSLRPTDIFVAVVGTDSVDAVSVSSGRGDDCEDDKVVCGGTSRCGGVWRSSSAGVTSDVVDSFVAVLHSGLDRLRGCAPSEAGRAVDPVVDERV